MNNVCLFNSDDIQKIAKSFLTKYKLMPFDYEKWYRKAYNVVNLIIARKADCNEEWQRIAFLWEKKGSEQLKRDIFKLLKEFSTTGIIDKIGELADKYGLPVGIIQKIVSLIIKYIFCCYLAFGATLSPDIVNTFGWIGNKKIRDNLPIPIDSRILYSLYEMGITNLGIKVYGGYAKIGDIPWTRIGLEDYKKIQEAVRKLSAQCGMSPIEFEMKKLWK